LEVSIDRISKLAAALGALALVIVSWSTPLRADTFAFEYYGPGVVGSGILQGSASDGYFITGVAGKRNGVGITGLHPASPNGVTNYSDHVGYFFYNNKIFPGQSPTLDVNGLLFDVPGLPLTNLYYDSGHYYDLSEPTFANIPVTLLIARATEFNFVYSGQGVSASGTLYTIDEGGGHYLTTWATGQRNGSPITGIQQTPVNLHGGYSYYSDHVGYFLYDNVLFHESPQVDNGGILFDVNGVPEVNLYSSGTQYFDLSEPSFDNIPVNLSITPEPSALILLVAGLMGLIVLKRRKVSLG
jgi:hypothetical protein